MLRNTFRCLQTAIVPIAGAFAIVLWLGNAAYMYLSVSFIQMLKVRQSWCPFDPADLTVCIHAVRPVMPSGHGPSP
jgi:drug/metabolite transporter superfamily protein YnfA